MNDQAANVFNIHHPGVASSLWSCVVLASKKDTYMFTFRMSSHLLSVPNLTNSGQAPLLQILWILDALGWNGGQRWEHHSLVRRDVLIWKSHMFPFSTIYRYCEGRKDDVFIGTPGEEGSNDFVGCAQAVTELVEGHAWLIARNGPMNQPPSWQSTD
ncbi:hypothetical protein F4808DRAFT_157749 [Astrocystis sublimbata]|nr:hypothetical protein F4808DRAFT_157749 [Astrocystis sublimbata]